MSQLRKNRVLVYRLKRTWGQVATLYVPVRSDHNVLTGEIIREYDTYIIKRAIVMPGILDRSFVYDLAYIAASKNFTGGAYFDRTKSSMIIDANDLPKTLTLKIKMHIEFDNKRHEIESIEMLPQRVAYMLTLQALSNSDTVG